MIMGSGRQGGFARSVANILVVKFHSRNCSWRYRCVVIMGSEECAILLLSRKRARGKILVPKVFVGISLCGDSGF